MGSACRELSSRIKTLSFLIEDGQFLSEINKRLGDIVNDMEAFTPQDYGILLERKKVSRPRCTFDRLPKPKKRKLATSGRVGVGAENQRTFSRIDVAEEKPLHEILEEYAPVDNAKYDIPLVAEVPVVSDTPVLDEIPVVCDTPVLDEIPVVCDVPLVEDVCKVEEIPEEKVSDVTVTKTVPANGKPKRRRKLVLSDIEIKRISGKKMLSDESINLMQNLIHANFPLYAGLFDTVTGKVNQMDIIPKSKNYIQILNVNNNHWVCVSNTDGNKCDNSVCYLYDSLASSEVAKEITKDVAAFSMCTDDSIHFITMPVHQQSNGVDCGVFAIAFAVALAHGKDPTLLAFEESLMRSHLLECLEDKKVRLFPTKDKRIKKCKTKTTTVRLYCTCRQPYDEKTTG